MDNFEQGDRDGKSGQDLVCAAIKTEAVCVTDEYLNMTHIVVEWLNQTPTRTSQVCMCS